MVGVGATTVHIAPGATSEVPLHTDPAGAARGRYYGYLTATSADGAVAVHTTLSLQVHAPGTNDRDPRLSPPRSRVSRRPAVVD
ncbi:hypothetical protein ACE6JH_01340 [Streptomyces nigra]